MQVYNSIIDERPRPAVRDQEQAAQLIKDRLIGGSCWASEARAAIAAHAAHDNSVILEGEPGTGKEFLARLIHKGSSRREGPFIAVSCHYVSHESIEAALFGLVRRLPTGGNYVSKGIVESAEGGTLFINGASTLAPALQSKIARLIKDREFCPAGGDRLEYIDARIILGSSPSQRPPLPSRAMLAEAEMVVSDRLAVPPLRQRAADIEPLARYFVKEFCVQLGKEPRGIASDAVSLLSSYDWPGNIAELKSAIHHMVQQAKPSELDASLLPAHMVNALAPGGFSFPPSGVDLCEEVKQFEVSLLCAALRRCHGVQYKAAQLLGIKPTTFNTKIMRYGIDVTSFK